MRGQPHVAHDEFEAASIGVNLLACAGIQIPQAITRQPARTFLGAFVIAAVELVHCPGRLVLYRWCVCFLLRFLAHFSKLHISLWHREFAWTLSSSIT